VSEKEKGFRVMNKEEYFQKLVTPIESEVILRLVSEGSSINDVIVL